MHMHVCACVCVRTRVCACMRVCTHTWMCVQPGGRWWQEFAAHSERVSPMGCTHPQPLLPRALPPARLTLWQRVPCKTLLSRQPQVAGQVPQHPVDGGDLGRERRGCATGRGCRALQGWGQGDLGKAPLPVVGIPLLTAGAGDVLRQHRGGEESRLMPQSLSLRCSPAAAPEHMPGILRAGAMPICSAVC